MPENCPNCGKFMIEWSPTYFECDSCQIHVDLDPEDHG